jgi:hypothetical protein
MDFCMEIEMLVISRNLQRYDLHVNVEFYVLIAVTMESPLFWDLMQGSPVVQHFGIMYCLHLQGQRVFKQAASLILNMVAIHSLKMSVNLSCK